MAPATQVGNVSTYTCGYDPSAPSPGVGLSASINAAFSGDTTYAAASAMPYTQVMSGTNALGGFTLASNTTLAKAGSYVLFTAILTGSNGDGAPTGSVSFYDASSASPTSPLTCAGGYTFTTNSPATGETTATCYYVPPVAYGNSHVITARYSGNVDYGSAPGGNSVTQSLS